MKYAIYKKTPSGVVFTCTVEPAENPDGYRVIDFDQTEFAGDTPARIARALTGPSIQVDSNREITELHPKQPGHFDNAVRQIEGFIAALVRGKP